MVSTSQQRKFIIYDRDSRKFIIDDSGKGFVYIIRAIGTNRFKIGFSKDPERRLLELQSSQSPFDLQIQKSHWFVDAQTLEGCLHKKYREFRVKGEWFEIPSELIIELAGAKSEYIKNKFPHLPNDYCFAGNVILSGIEDLHDKTTVIAFVDFVNHLISECGDFSRKINYNLIRTLAYDVSQKLFCSNVARYGDVQYFDNSHSEESDRLFWLNQYANECLCAVKKYNNDPDANVVKYTDYSRLINHNFLEGIELVQHCISGVSSVFRNIDKIYEPCEY